MEEMDLMDDRNYDLRVTKYELRRGEKMDSRLRGNDRKKPGFLISQEWPSGEGMAEEKNGTYRTYGTYKTGWRKGESVKVKEKKQDPERQPKGWTQNAADANGRDGLNGR